MEIVRTLVILGIGQAFFIGALLFWIKKENKKANRILGVFLILVGISLIPSLIGSEKILEKAATTVLFAFGPLLLLYFRTLVGYKKSSTRIIIIHFIPFLANLIYIALLLLMNSLILSSFSIIFHISRIVSALIYAVSILILIRRYQIELKNKRSSVAYINLNWLKYLLLGFLGLFALIAVIGALSLIGISPLTPDFNEQIVALGVAFYLFSFGFFGFRQAELFYLDPESENKKYQSSTLSEQQAIEHVERLKKVMDRDKPFLDPDLSLRTLSQMTKISHYQLSQVINEKLKMNFYDFINSYRINIIKDELLKIENQQYTILGLALDHGFNSKSAFNKAFKLHTGFTPSAFKRDQKQKGPG